MPMKLSLELKQTKLLLTLLLLFQELSSNILLNKEIQLALDLIFIHLIQMAKLVLSLPNQLQLLLNLVFLNLKKPMKNHTSHKLQNKKKILLQWNKQKHQPDKLKLLKMLPKKLQKVLKERELRQEFQ